jgi:hypothetical protein
MLNFILTNDSRHDGCRRSTVRFGVRRPSAVAAIACSARYDDALFANYEITSFRGFFRCDGVAAQYLACASRLKVSGEQSL